MKRPPTGRELTPWETDPPDDESGKSLSEVLRDGVMVPSRLDEKDASQIAVRVAPIGYRGIIRQLAREYRVSYSSFHLHALDHGIAKLNVQEPIISLRRAYDQTSSAAMSSGDSDALTRLNQVATYEFKHPQALRTTLTVTNQTAARIGDLAIVCGMPSPRLAVLTVLVSVLTLPNNRGYRDALVDEVEAFQRFVVYRRRVLLMGDAPGGRGRLR